MRELEIAFADPMLEVPSVEALLNTAALRMLEEANRKDKDLSDEEWEAIQLLFQHKCE